MYFYSYGKITETELLTSTERLWKYIVSSVANLPCWGQLVFACLPACLPLSLSLSLSLSQTDRELQTDRKSLIICFYIRLNVHFVPSSALHIEPLLILPVYFTPTVCNLPAEPGPCKVYIQRYFFDKADGTCKTFTYGGCQGNGNSFATKRECEKTCIVDVPAGSPASATTPSKTVSTPATPNSRQIEICQMPAEPGPCFTSFPSFFFNTDSGQCERFNYGGCRGNENRFQSVQACELACRGVERRPAVGAGSVSGPTQPATTSGRFLSRNSECNLPRAAGLCMAFFPSYFYNTQTGECESFVYGGCQGNANRFDSRMQCEQKCKAGTTRPNLNAACLQPLKVGRCMARIISWFFDLDTMTCRMFYYGGCGGNDNNFRSQMACEQLCGPTAAKPALAAATAANLVSSAAGVLSSRSRPQLCSQPKLTGPCRASIRSYYFNSWTSECEMFIYGGCKGNDNRFATLKDCQTTCRDLPSRQPQQPQELNPVRDGVSIQPLPDNQDTCSQPKVVGFCRAAMPRYFYNKNTRLCENFIYGGCGGNDNNFRSYSACVRKCVNNARCLAAPPF